ncbi:hypothetical protein HPB50_022717 [Hyalomma asiaticum]|uniref:Uncharacterized protein n=1 Tax=Hyalomma asiaticum TaxID=266040 RepID=A0ACB7S8J0_HYAAI|nr:hypothetical protein HPB50_022717 [Hyalomma asiaticum]
MADRPYPQQPPLFLQPAAIPWMSSPVDTMDRDTAPALDSWSGFSNKEIRRVFVRKFDFTSCAGFLFVAVWALFLFGILTIFTYNKIMHTVYATLGAILFMAFLAFDTQMLMGGRKLELSPEEHIFAALQLYMDIVQIFLFILRIMGRR